ncbi:MAG TPA: hypothetical protein DCG69_06795 [Bacteroidales bacterium]|nr:hypothetical protein [Bacteroidales bacterium]
MKKITFLFIALIISSSIASFGQSTASSQDTKSNVNVQKGNRLSLMLSDVLVRRVSVEYEHIFSDGKISLNIPFSVTVSPFDDLWSSEVHWWAGMGVKFYPTGQGVVRYFLGPEFRFISVTESEYNYYYDTNNNYYNYTTDTDYINTAFLLNNGIIYSPTNDFFVSLSLGVGFLSRNPDSTNESLVPYATPSFRLGFKF